jgi:hypothetical protein
MASGFEFRNSDFPAKFWYQFCQITPVASLNQTIEQKVTKRTKRLMCAVIGSSLPSFPSVKAVYGSRKNEPSCTEKPKNQTAEGFRQAVS